jgi:hypothetical protein
MLGSFNTLKELLITLLIFSYYNIDAKTLVETDALNRVIISILL